MIRGVRVLLRVLCVLFTVSWWVVPAMGVIDLSVTWDADWPVVLEAGWGVLMTVALGLPFLLTAVRPGLARAALAQVLVVAATLALAALVGQEPQMWWIGVMLVVETPALWALADRGRPVRSADLRLLVLALAAAPVGASYAWAMWADNRQTLFDSDLTNDTDHYSVQGALGLVLVALPVLAALRPAARRLAGTSTALAAGYLGLVSACWQGQPAGSGTGWSVATMAWAVVVLLVSWSPLRLPDDPSVSDRSAPEGRVLGNLSGAPRARG
jgi:hypothetical protein